jgi:hypothetical protein
VYEERKQVLAELGFKGGDYEWYRRSALWKLIRKHIYQRDGGECAAILCDESAECVHHMNYSYQTLLGVNPASLVCLCKSCHEHVEFFKGEKVIQLEELRTRTIQLLYPTWTRGRFPPGGVGPKIGKWLKARWEINKPLARSILAELKATQLRWYNQIVREINNGNIPKTYAKYLGLR